MLAKGKATEEAKAATEARVLELQSKIEVIATKENSRILIFLGASNKKAQSALTKKFGEVADKFDIAKKRMECAAAAVRSFKPGATTAGSNDAGATPFAK